MFSLIERSHKGVAITPGFMEITLISFLFSTISELNKMSSALLEAQYGAINGKIPKLAIELMFIILPPSISESNSFENFRCENVFI